MDFNLPQRFKLQYSDNHNEKQQPVMLHRAILGSFERFIGILTEHCGGEFPFFIAPIQVGIIPISQNHFEYAKKIQKALMQLGVDSEIYEKNESLNKRIRTAEKQRLPMIIVLGDEETAKESVALRDRRAKQQSNLGLEEFINLIKEKMNEVHF